eukprot:2772760-Rhodomonas_salina.1
MEGWRDGGMEGWSGGEMGEQTPGRTDRKKARGPRKITTGQGGTYLVQGSGSQLGCRLQVIWVQHVQCAGFDGVSAVSSLGVGSLVHGKSAYKQQQICAQIVPDMPLHVFDYAV